MEKLSSRQRAILEFIKEEVRKKGYPPSVREIGQAVGLASSSTVHGHLARLEKKGYIRRDPTKPRAIEILDVDPPATEVETTLVPVLGKVTAGQPIEAIEAVEETFPLPKDWVNNDTVFMLRVEGNSMINAGIFDGDLVIVRQQPVANNGDIVVALIEDEATVKRFFKEQDHIRLQPENRFMDPIIVPDCQILGKVVGLVRRMG